MCGQTSRQAHMQAERLVSRVLYHEVESIFVTGWCQVQAALLTQMSTWPSPSIARRTSATTSASLLTSAEIGTQRTPLACSRAMAAGSGLRLAMARSTPSSASAVAIPSPMPLDPPVISAVLPLRPVSMRDLLWMGRGRRVVQGELYYGCGVWSMCALGESSVSAAHFGRQDQSNDRPLGAADTALRF
jgi:hypothetical protein